MSQFIASLKEQNLPFVLFKSPSAEKIQCYYQQSLDSYYTENFTESGFVFAPFDRQFRYLFIPSTHSESFARVDLQTKTRNSALIISDKGKQNFLENVDYAKKHIANQSIEKVVLSASFSFPIASNALEVFNKLSNKYPEAFVYYWSHPQTGQWLGASPEKLLSLKGNQLATMSLAGTLAGDKTETDWTTKEYHEQLLVTQHIENRLLEITSSKHIHVGERFTLNAGALKHLCTPISAHLERVDLLQLIHLLHPTPAVGGLPVKAALDFIDQYEVTPRSFYTGFMGPFSGSDQVDLFVNLRCGEIKSDLVRVYAGAGITSESHPQKEWDEITRKANTFLDVL